MPLPNVGGHTDGTNLIATGDANKEAKSNNLDALLDNMENHVSALSVTAGGTFNLDTPQGNLDQYLETGLLRITGTPGAATIVIVPDGDKRIAIENVSGQDVTFDTLTGAALPIVIADNTTRILHFRGIEITLIGGAELGALLADGSLNPTGDFNWADFELARALLKDYAETRNNPASSGGTLTLDLETGNAFEITLTENTVFTFSNPPATGIMGSFTLILKQDGAGGWTTTLPATVDWAEGVAPTLTTTINAVDILSFMTVDAGARWFGFLGGKDFG